VEKNLRGELGVKMLRCDGCFQTGLCVLHAGQHLDYTRKCLAVRALPGKPFEICGCATGGHLGTESLALATQYQYLHLKAYILEYLHFYFPVLC
jgi:hypothetical protein